MKLMNLIHKSLKLIHESMKLIHKALTLIPKTIEVIKVSEVSEVIKVRGILTTSGGIVE